MQKKKDNLKKEVTDEHILSFYGLATRAGKTVSGMDMVSTAIGAGRVFILLVAEDASDRTREKIAQLSRQYKIPCFMFSDREELGKFSGKSGRAICGVIDEGFAKKMQLLLTENKGATQM